MEQIDLRRFFQRKPIASGNFFRNIPPAAWTLVRDFIDPSRPMGGQTRYSNADADMVAQDFADTVHGQALNKRQLEKALRNVGLSHRQAKTVISQGTKALENERYR